LGDPIAIGVGVQIEKERRLLLLISVALAGVCVFVGRRHYVLLRPDRPAYSQEISGGETCKTNLRFLIAVICQYIRKSNHGTDGIAGGDYLFDNRRAVFYLLTRKKHLNRKKPIFQDASEDGVFCRHGGFLERI